MAQAVRAKSPKKSSSDKSIDADRLLKALREADASSFRNPVELLSHLGFPSPLLLRSNEAVRLKRLVSWLLETTFANFNVSVATFYGGELNSKASFEPMFGALRNLSLFAQNQAVVVHGIEGIKTQHAATFAEEIKRSPFTLLILTASSEAKSIPLLDKHDLNITSLELASLHGAALERWIAKELKTLGATATQGAAKLLATSYENDLGGLSQQLLTLSLLTDREAPIDENLVRDFALKSAEQTSFELVAQIAARNTVRAQKITNDLLSQGLVPLQINAFLGRSFRMMLAQKAMAESGSTVSLPQDLSHPWFLRKLSPALGRFSASKLKEAVTICADLDLSLKSSGLPPELALSLAVTRLATA